MASATIQCNISGKITFSYDSADDLERLLNVLEQGMRTEMLFNDDIKDLTEAIRELLEKVA